MRHIEFDPEALQGEQRVWFVDWQARAAAAELRDQTLAVGDQAQTQQVWSDLKTWLLEHVFHGKCAYCEFRFIAGAWGDAEHYRPKGRVSERSASGKSVVTGPNQQPHAGYRWLAYKWWNLIPACDKCNTSKSDQFPVHARRVFDRSELVEPVTREELNAKEEPLLLHPYDDDPDEHLIFGLDGRIAPREDSPRGRATIDVCDLKRDTLQVDRSRHQEFARTALGLALNQWMVNNCDESYLDDFRRKWTWPDNTYSAAARVIFDMSPVKLQEDIAGLIRAP